MEIAQFVLAHSMRGQVIRRFHTSSATQMNCNFTLIRTLQFTSILHINRSPHANWRIRGHDTDDGLLVAVHKLPFTSMAEMKRNN